MEKRKRRRFKLSRKVRVRRLLVSFLNGVEDENEDLRYIADAVLRHFIKDEESLCDFLSAAGGVRAHRMYKAVKRLYKKGDAFGDTLRQRLHGVVFAQDVSRKQREIKKAEKTAEPLIGLTDRRGW